MPVTMLDKLIQSVTILFVLSLGVERVTALFKRRDWQLLHPLRNWRPSGLRVALDTKSVTHDGQPVVDPDVRDRAIRGTHAENTLAAGVLLAFATRANAFGELIPLGNPADHVGAASLFAYWATWALQVAMTGAAAGIGSSFWYDLLNLLVEVRRTRSELAQAAQGGRASGQAAGQAPGQPAPGGIAVNLQRAGTAASELRAAAEQAARGALGALAGVARTAVVEAPGVPGLEVLVEIADPGALRGIPDSLAVSGPAGNVQLPVVVQLRRAA